MAPHGLVDAAARWVDLPPLSPFAPRRRSKCRICAALSPGSTSAMHLAGGRSAAPGARHGFCAPRLSPRSSRLDARAFSVPAPRRAGLCLSPPAGQRGQARWRCSATADTVAPASAAAAGRNGPSRSDAQFPSSAGCRPGSWPATTRPRCRARHGAHAHRGWRHQATPQPRHHGARQRVFAAALHGGQRRQHSPPRRHLGSASSATSRAGPRSACRSCRKGHGVHRCASSSASASLIRCRARPPRPCRP